ncbi:hypothetical protein HK104_010594 [Borealophlyctis nickersoniae]|nr:hypothetical protein HK104_010594 [Borealophlyctis nickersoniae]
MYRMPAPPRHVAPARQQQQQRPGSSSVSSGAPDNPIKVEADFYRDMIAAYAIQKEKRIPEISFKQEGPPHSPKWTVGQGSGTTKLQATWCAWINSGHRFENKAKDFAVKFKETYNRASPEPYTNGQQHDTPAQAPVIVDRFAVLVDSTKPKPRSVRSYASPFVATGGKAKEDESSIWTEIEFRMEPALSRLVGIAAEDYEKQRPFPERHTLIPPPKYQIKPVPSPDATSRNAELQKNKMRLLTNPRYNAQRRERETLPVYEHAAELITSLETNDAVVIAGPPGSGKSTEVPAILLDKAIDKLIGAQCNILVTSPRDVHSTSTANRVAELQHEMVGGGVIHRWDDPNVTSPAAGGSITFATAATVLLALQDSEKGKSPFDSASHVIIDEVQEADLTTQLLIGAAKRDIMRKRKKDGVKPPKLVLMLTSSELHVSTVVDFLEGNTTKTERKVANSEGDSEGASGSEKDLNVGIIFVQKSLETVNRHYLHDIIEYLSAMYQDRLPPQLESLETKEFEANELEFARNPNISGNLADFAEEDEIDTSEAGARERRQLNIGIPYDLLCLTLAHICRLCAEGAILVFLPSLEDIRFLRQKLLTDSPLGADFTDTTLYQIHVLHPGIVSFDSRMFESPPAPIRKIVFSTSIAESNVTIPDVGYVLDAGKSLVSRYHSQRRAIFMTPAWASRAQVEQRVGQAGQATLGQYFGFFSKERIEHLPPLQDAPIKGVDPAEACLRVKGLYPELPVGQTLDWLLPTNPDGTAALQEEVKLAAVNSLRTLGAFDFKETMAPLGRILAKIPLSADFAKLLLFSIIFRCFDPMLTIVSVASTHRSLFSTANDPADVQHIRSLYAAGVESDHSIWVNVFSEWRLLRDAGRSDEELDRHCTMKYLRRETLDMVERARMHIARILLMANILPSSFRMPEHGWEMAGDVADCNANADNSSLVRALLCVGLYPHIAQRTKFGGKLGTREDESFADPHPKRSVLGEGGLTSKGQLYIYQEKMFPRGGGPAYLIGCTRAIPLALIVLGCGLNTKQTFEGMMNGFRRIRFVMDDVVSLLGRETPPTLGDLSKAMIIRSAVVEMIDAWVTRLEGYGRTKKGGVAEEIEWEKKLVKLLADAFAETEGGW